MWIFGKTHTKMSEDSLAAAGSFMIADYVVFVLVLVVSAATGFYYAWINRGKQSPRDFLTGGRTLTAFPISLSLTASFLSTVSVLSNPVEVYHYGAIFVYVSLGHILSTVVVSEVYLPVFYRLGITSTNEYLQMRFNKFTRLLGTVLYIVQTILYTGVVIYGPALALSQIVDVHLWGGILTTGFVCTLYCTLGGLKAVVWTDVFQIGIMLAGYMAIVIKSIIRQGGVLTILSDSKQGGRLNFLDFDINPLRRNTFWTLVFGPAFGLIYVNGITQAQVQRYVACKSITHARVALFICMIGLSTFLGCSVFAGMCLYSIYKNCDPLTAGQISAPDQLMPHLMLDVLTGNTGLPGLFFAAVCSGSLSTVSSTINSLAAVTLEDLIKPHTNMSEKQLLWMSKGLSILFGLLCISMAGLASVMGGMLQASVTIGATFGGPLLGLFSLGILCPFANCKGSVSGLVSGLAVSTCVSIGFVIYPPPPSMTRPLSLTTEGCNFTTPDGLNWTSTVLPTQPTSMSVTTAQVNNNTDNHLLVHHWHSPSYLYFCVIGTVTAFTVGLIVSLLTGGWKTRVESEFMLMKEDTTLYHLYTFIRDKVRGAEMPDPTISGEQRDGNTNPGFCDIEMDSKSKIST